MPHHDRLLPRGLGRTLFTAFAGLHLALGAVATGGCAADGDRDRDDTADRAAHPAALDPAALHDHLFAELDADGDGALTASELHAHHREMFARADRDHDGRLARAELQAAPFPGPMLADHLDQLDADGDGALTHDEIAAAMARHHDHAPDPAAAPGAVPGH